MFIKAKYTSPYFLNFTHTIKSEKSCKGGKNSPTQNILVSVRGWARCACVAAITGSNFCIKSYHMLVNLQHIGATALVTILFIVLMTKGQFSAYRFLKTIITWDCFVLDCFMFIFNLFRVACYAAENPDSQKIKSFPDSRKINSFPDRRKIYSFPDSQKIIQLLRAPILRAQIKGYQQK